MNEQSRNDQSQSPLSPQQLSVVWKFLLVTSIFVFALAGYFAYKGTVDSNITTMLAIIGAMDFVTGIVLYLVERGKRDNV